VEVVAGENALRVVMEIVAESLFVSQWELLLGNSQEAP